MTLAVLAPEHPLGPPGTPPCDTCAPKPARFVIDIDGRRLPVCGDCLPSYLETAIRDHHGFVPASVSMVPA